LAVTVAPAVARDGSVTSFDGTKIAYHFYPRPGLAAGQRAPTLMDGPGYASGGAAESDATVQAALNDGYNVLTWDPRGFGQSGGQVEVDSPMYEGRDSQALIDMLATQPEVLLDKPGDPRLGMIGASYGGGIQLTTAAIDPRVDAIAPQIAWNSLITSLDKDNTAKGGWGSVLVAGGTAGSAPGASNDPAGFGPTGRQDPHTTAAFEDGLATGEFSAADQSYFLSRGPSSLLGQIHVPTLLMEGTDDTLFTLHEAIVNFKTLEAQGVPVQMLWFCGGLSGGPVAHGVCNTPVGPDPHIDTDYALRWLDHYLKGNGGSVGPRFSWVSDAGELHGAGDYPPAQGAPVTATGSGTLVMTAGDTSGALIEAQPATNAVDVNLPTPATGAEMLGEPTLTLTYAGTAANSDGRAYAQLVDNRSHLVLGNQVTPIPLTLDGATHTITRPLEAIAADVTAGKSYTLQITDGSDVYFAARQPGVVKFTSINLSVPTVARNAGQPVTPLSPPPVKACPAATGRVSGRSLGPVTLGMTRKNARRALRFSATRGRKYMDFFCLSPIGIRVGYTSPQLLRAQSRGTQRRLRGRAVLILTANRRYGLRGVRPGSRLAPVAHRLGVGRPFKLGLNTWYFASRRGANYIVKVRHGVIEEIGLANRQLTTGRARQRLFLRTFY
jgi:ABC-2 type transport system ATP-binding protein